jgi:hypothetical protein
MFLCLAYCSVMALITFVYGVKFALRAEELKRHQEFGDLNITYYVDSNESANVSMMSFELNESDALDKTYFTLEQLATRRFGNGTNVAEYDVERYAAEIVKIDIPDAGGREIPYMIFGVEGNLLTLLSPLIPLTPMTLLTLLTRLTLLTSV